ncbi:ATP-binding protein [Desulfopila aestuarii]|uniref:histidine kinase n=1 Tax=Desulfopila aestuarii DSM 18488 TaxID=1121416 RepID=A0A1M7Y4Y0_9BACT|nr:ATP-binding protein [Desulfopila aestuarii]SHO47426.1 PAS domain S-box-containing protein [Desulfopila aestuarii DSM 18488]
MNNITNNGSGGWKFGRLARKQLLWILAFSSLVTLLGTCFQLFTEYRNDTAYIREQFERVRRAHLDTLARSLWEFADEQIDTQLASILSIRDIVAIEVIENTGGHYFKGEIQPQIRTESIEYEIIFDGKGREERLGKLVLTASFEGVYTRLKKRILIILTTQAAKTFFVSLFILYVINHLVMRHLETIARYATGIEASNLDRRLTLHRKKTLAGHSDELDEVVDAVNSMGQRLQDDIVALQKSEYSLRESEERYRTIFENAVEGFFQSTPNGRFLSVNPAFARMFGYASPEELIRSITDVEAQFYYYPLDRKRFQKAVDQQGVIVNFEFLAKRKDGTPIWVCNNTRCYFDEDGKIIRYEGTVTDIHKRKVAEHERERLQVQLIKAQKMESIGNLAGGIAHDFNNILSAILGYAELSLLHLEKDSPLHNNLSGIRKAGERARDLVKQILTFARQSEEELAPVKIKGVAEEALSFIRSTIPSAIQIRQVLDSEWLVLGNVTQINQIFMNICTNAAHSMEETGGFLDVTLKDIDLPASLELQAMGLRAGEYVRIVISDTGTGIRPEIADRIFEPYFSTKRVGRGTGMGLAIVHGIVEGYGGKILFESEVGKGTTFTIYLPRCSQVETHPVKGGMSAALPGGKERILFVDDEEAIVRTSGKILEMLGYEVTIRTDSISALRLVEAEPAKFDLLLTDMNMPEMTGDILIARVRALQPEIPVILCTGYSQKLTDTLLSELRVDSCLYKPITSEVMASTVRRVLDTRKKPTMGKDGPG